MEQIRVQIAGEEFSVIGDSFWAMLARVREVPGRSYREVGKQKVWVLPCTLEEARTFLQPMRIVSEDGLLDAEIEDIRRVQVRILELTPVIEQRITDLDNKVGSYSRNSKSSIKGGLARDSSLLGYALIYAREPVEQLTEPQVKTMYAALREMEE